MTKNRKDPSSFCKRKRYNGEQGARVRLFIARADGLEGRGNGRARGIERVDDERARVSEKLIICTYIHIHMYTHTHAYTEDEGKWENDEHTYLYRFYALASHQRQTKSRKKRNWKKGKKIIIIIKRSRNKTMIQDSRGEKVSRERSESL